MDFFLRIAILIVFALWQTYWWITAKRAYKEKPRVFKKKDFVDYYLLRPFFLFIILQLLGVDILQMHPNFNISFVGVISGLLGVAISVSGRVSLGTNWANAHEYQIKQKQILVTKGIYKYIRHPIYTGMLFALTGAELVCQSYLFIVVFMVMFIWAYTRGKREEKILEEHFGKEYVEYKKRSKMLIPFIF